MNKEIDLEADFIEEEDPSAYGVTVRAATLDKLAEFCLEEFGEFGVVIVYKSLKRGNTSHLRMISVIAFYHLTYP